MKKRTQTLTVQLPSGSVAGSPTIAGKITTDSAYDRVTGIRVYETGNTAQVYRLGLVVGSSGSVIKDLVYKNEWLSSTAVTHEGRTVPVDIPAKGSEYSIQFDPITNLTENVDLDIVFDLESES